MRAEDCVGRRSFRSNQPTLTGIPAARAAGIAVEINASPSRLDLNDVHARRAGDLGIPITISTDAHAIAQLDFMRYGVAVARRAWLTAPDILNTRPERALSSWLKARSPR